MTGRALLLALFWLLAGTAQSAVATFQGEALEDLTGLRTDRLEVAAYRDGELRSVRHQWLAWSQRGWPYFSEDDDSRRAGETGRVGPRDRLLVDDADGGERLPSPGQEVIGELALDSDGERPVYFYLLARPPFQGFTPPVTLERDDDGDPLSLRTADYRLEFLDGNLFQWGDFTYRHYRAPDDKPQRTLLDSLKLRLSAGVFSEGARLTLTNENLDPQIQQVIEGPLATLVYATTRVRVAGLRVLTVHNHFVLMENRLAIHSRFALPGIAATVLRDPRARVSVDGHDLQGARLRTSWTGEREAVVDGRLSDTERAMLRRPVPAENWLRFDTGRGFALLARLHFAEGFDTGARLIYQDDPDLEETPERFPGQQPNVGFEMDRIPFGENFYFLAELHFSEKNYFPED
ncbi:hypothetical protein [Alloalcanivorax venustensis]|uniref:hypothetical protein n=1 Tax=Alloalcanivorax venustensis TaxID=172371 RepID=UPI0035172575